MPAKSPLLYSKRSKAVVDLVLIIGLVALKLCDADSATGNYWLSVHGIIGTVWILFCALHIVQHWAFIRSLTRKQVLRKSSFTAAVVVLSVAMLATVIAFLFGFTPSWLRAHHILGELFFLFLIGHFIQRFKQFKLLFR